MSRDRIDSRHKIVFVPSRRVRLDKQKLAIPVHKIILKSDDVWKKKFKQKLSTIPQISAKRHMKLEIKVHTWDMHKHVGVQLNLLMGCQPFPLENWISS